MEWFNKTFAALGTEELYQIVQLRQQVFVVEQNCVYLDADGYDRAALHLFAVQQGCVVAYCRLLPPGLKYQEASIGRVCTALAQRGSGLGRELMQRALTLAAASYSSGGERSDLHTEIRISAQLYLQNFYSSLGFSAVSAPYDEDGIPHIEMLFSA
ncbi:MAG: GNAT family N-acetyltransferase [Gammaproteobacteria bacterium]|nr:GNAT family N-acetyltransferase [Gammaproteobacteria bacterium]